MTRLIRATLLALLTSSTLASCSHSKAPLPAQSKAQNHRIQSLVLHFTAGNFKQSLFALKESGSVSAHYLIPAEDDETYRSSTLQVLQLVEEGDRAWHAGLSYWQGRSNLNDTSIGIEIVNKPECKAKTALPPMYFSGGEYGIHMDCEFPPFSPQQVALLIELSKDILRRNPDIDPTRVIGHSDIAPARKSDPGPSFPWYQLYQNGIGAWYDTETVDWYQNLFNYHSPDLALLQRALAFYGYKIAQSGVLDPQTQDVIYAFQSHFTPDRVTGQPSVATAAVLFALLDKYKPHLNQNLLASYFDRAELAFSGKVTSANEFYTWHQAKFGKKGGYLALANLTSIAGAELTVLVDAKVSHQFEVPAGVNAMSLQLSQSKGSHIVEIKSSKDISQLNHQIKPHR